MPAHGDFDKSDITPRSPDRRRIFPGVMYGHRSVVAVMGEKDGHAERHATNWVRLSPPLRELVDTSTNERDRRPATVDQVAYRGKAHDLSQRDTRLRAWGPCG